MVDFRKRLSTGSASKKIDPIELYDTLDRISDKGELRRAQEAILKNWHGSRRSDKDVILKLHTGQGKTLIGLLILQSKMNEASGSAVYLCPNNFLIEQTCIQAKQFGIETCTAEGDLPSSFLDGQSILVTSVQKMFNGRTKFRLGNRAVPVSYIVMDDCHACVDSVRDAFTFRMPAGHDAYGKILQLFRDALASQGAGTLREMEAGRRDSFLPVPYWEWMDKNEEVVNILGSAVLEEDDRKEKPDFWFPWPLLKNGLQGCQCLISGKGLEISPYLPPLNQFRSFVNANHRVFMSATVTNDAFLVKGLKLSSKTIANPLIYPKEKWSGEKMILIPSLIHPSLVREGMIPQCAKLDTSRDYGLVALVPSFVSRAEWENHGSLIATTDNIGEYVDRLRKGDFDRPVVLANRYDGVDLPDRMCRLLVLDSKPRGETLVSAYEQECRANSEITAIRDARAIEQGLGRSVRGEKDYCAIALIGEDLVQFVRSPTTRKHLSSQTRMQIEIGLDIARFAQEDLKSRTATDVFWGLVNQCLSRDSGWKDYYAEKMETIVSDAVNTKVLEMFEAEVAASEAHESSNSQEAVRIIQELIDGKINDASDRAWYLQEMARYSLPIGKEECFRLQLVAFNQNRYLLRPPSGVSVVKLQASKSERTKLILDWVSKFENYEQLNLAVQEILARLSFGVKAERFEEALRELGTALGFASERPDKAWKEGPDNLWELKPGQYWLIEDKNEVNIDRAEINKSEAAQINISCAWFKKHYPGVTSFNTMIIPTRKLSSAAAFSEPVTIMTERELRKLKYAVRLFFEEFSLADFTSLPESSLFRWLTRHKLQADDFLSEYSAQPKT